MTTSLNNSSAQLKICNVGETHRKGGQAYVREAKSGIGPFLGDLILERIIMTRHLVAASLAALMFAAPVVASAQTPAAPAAPAADSSTMAAPKKAKHHKKAKAAPAAPAADSTAK
jgi:hypothetical protein